MRLLAIDPGSTETAWVCWDGTAILAHGKEQNDRFIADLIEHVCRLNVTLVAIEMVQSFGMAVGADVFETVYWIGRYAERVMATGIETRRVFRKDVKMHLCQSFRAKDPNIRQALIDRVGAPGTKKQPGPTYGISGDCWAALAVAITAMDTRP